MCVYSYVWRCLHVCVYLCDVCVCVHTYVYIVLPSRISLTLSCHLSLLSIAPRRSSRLYPVLAQSYCRELLAGRPAFARPCEGVHRSISPMSSFLLLQQCPACLVRLTLIAFVMGGRWLYSCCFVGFCLQDLFNIACSILVWLPSSFYSVCLVSVHLVHPYNSIDTTAIWKRLRFILSVRSDFHMTGSLLIAVYVFDVCFSWWDTASYMGELVNYFQRLTL